MVMVMINGQCRGIDYRHNIDVSLASFSLMLVTAQFHTNPWVCRGLSALVTYTLGPTSHPLLRVLITMEAFRQPSFPSHERNSRSPAPHRRPCIASITSSTRPDLLAISLAELDLDPSTKMLVDAGVPLEEAMMVMISCDGRRDATRKGSQWSQTCGRGPRSTRSRRRRRT